MVPKLVLLAAAMLAALPVMHPAAAQPPYRNVGSGKEFLPFEVIKERVTRVVGGRLIGADMDLPSGTYQMRYVVGTKIVDVVVDARTAKILERRESM